KREPASARPDRSPSAERKPGFIRRRILPWVAAPLAMAIVFGLGLAAVWVPPIPRVVTSSVGPTIGSVGEPVRLVIPSLDIDAPVVPIELDRDRVLRPPNDPSKVGWWDRSAQPGAKKGQSLLTGHSVRLGDGAMDTLGDVKRGATVQIMGKKDDDEKEPKVASYLVQKVFVYSRKQVADHSEELFGQDHHSRRLVLVTCTDWDGHAYESNIIVYAQPA
ncbi:MAG TPA: class F sortase, partial [Aeromicrobium sp.]|nr:class F sortase [Aeromicrobium sp.]